MPGPACRRLGENPVRVGRRGKHVYNETAEESESAGSESAVRARALETKRPGEVQLCQL